MDRLQLKQCLEAAGVPEDRYLLVGLDPPRAVREGACIVRPNQRNWEVLLWQLEEVPCLFSFLNEDQACDFALDVLTPAALRFLLLAPAADPADDASPGGDESDELAPAAVGAGRGERPAMTAASGPASATTKRPLQL